MDCIRKYRVLDDCARLREVIETFPEDQHFIPSILFVLWGEDESEVLPDDLRLMVCFFSRLYQGLSSHEIGRRLQSKTYHRTPHDVFLNFRNNGSGREVSASAEFDEPGHDWWACGNSIPARYMLCSYVRQLAGWFTRSSRVSATGHRPVEGLCLRLGGKMHHGQ